MNNVNITYLKTIYKDCDPSGVRAEPSKSCTIRFCGHTSNSHATIMSLLSPAFLTAQELSDEKISNEPYHMSIIWTYDLNRKRKEENAETSLEALEYFLINLKAPTNGAIISIYHANEGKEHHPTQWRHTQVWPFAERWNPQGQYITVHKTEPLMATSRIRKTKQSEIEMLPYVQNCAEKYGYNIKYVDYTMKAQEIYETMRYSDYHFCYAGATYYTAAMVGVPALAWHHMDVVKYDQVLLETKELTSRFSQVFQINGWGLSTSSGKIRQYDWETNKVITKPNQEQKFIEKKSDIEKAFLGMMK